MRVVHSNCDVVLCYFVLLCGAGATIVVVSFVPMMIWRRSQFGVVVNTFVSIGKVTLRRARLVLGWMTVSGVHLPVYGRISLSHPGQLSLAIPLWVGAMSTTDGEENSEFCVTVAACDRECSHTDLVD